MSGSDKQAWEKSSNPAAADWLPYRRQPSLSTRSLYTARLIEKNKHKDWFFALAWALKQERANSLQVTMLAKVYVFLCDFIPRGLIDNNGAGSLFGHISGDEVMEHLLSHGETTPSRHSISKHADTSFQRLEAWMGQWDNWQEALRHSRAECDKQKAAGRKKAQWRAPGLHTPAGMMAVLVLAHPDDTKFKEWIGRLQIQWMMLQDPQRLSVKDGFWRGISIQNLTNVFSGPLVHDTAEALQLDYSRIFGQAFEACKEDIRPFIPTRVQKSIVPLENEPSNEEAEVSPAKDDEANVDQGRGASSPLSSDPDIDSILGDDIPAANGDAGAAMETDIPTTEEAEDAGMPQVPKDLEQELREHLGFCRPSRSVAPVVLKEWLLLKLGQADRETSILYDWCDHWFNRIAQPERLVDQVIIREQFLQSLRRLHSLDGLSTPSVADAYMLADSSDNIPKSYGISFSKKAKQTLQESPEHTTYVEVETLLQKEMDKDSANKAASSYARTFTEERTKFFLRVTSEKFFEHWKDVVVFETMRSLTLLRCLREMSEPKGKGRDWAHEGLDPDDVLELQITPSQHRVLLLPHTDREIILTKCQSACFQQLILDSNEIQTPRDTPLPLVALARGEEATAYKRRLHKLLGDLDVGDDSVAQWLIATSTTPFRQRVSLAPSSTTPARGRSTSKPASEARRSTTPAGRAAVMPKPDSQPAMRRPKSPRWQPTTPNPVPGQNGATTGRPDSNSQHRTPRPTPPQSSTGTRSAFAGKKRPSDDGHGGRASKTPRLSLAGEVTMSIDKAKDELLKEAKVLKSDLTTIKTDTASAIGDLSRMMQEMMDALDESRGKQAPALGGDGYLTLNCPAPAGWNQSMYVGQLERAAWWYIWEFWRLGDPDQADNDTGVSEDEATIEATKARFPELPESHIIVALKHIHVRTFHRPLGAGQEQEAEAEAEVEGDEDAEIGGESGSEGGSENGETYDTFDSPDD